jgi:hypothetical protein
MVDGWLCPVAHVDERTRGAPRRQRMRRTAHSVNQWLFTCREQQILLAVRAEASRRVADGQDETRNIN